MQKILFLLLLIILPLSDTLAAEYSVRPFLIDKTLEPRDIVTETVQLTNDHTARKYVVYATVNEISVDLDGEIKDFVTPVMTDRTNTPTSWVEVTRGRIEIPPGEKREVPITLRINPEAEPGEYHVFVGFVPAPNRPAAEQIAMNGEADGVVVKITVDDKRESSMKINSFLVNRFIYKEGDREIRIELENLGDLPATPKGEIIFYDSRGIEIGSEPVNTDSQIINPGEKLTLTNSVSIDNTVGRFKSNLIIKYGEGEKTTLQDTAYFYIVPWLLLLIIFGGILLLVLILTYLIRRNILKDDYLDDGEHVTMYVRDGHEPNPQDHDIDLKNIK